MRQSHINETFKLTLSSAYQIEGPPRLRCAALTPSLHRFGRANLALSRLRHDNAASGVDESPDCFSERAARRTTEEIEAIAMGIFKDEAGTAERHHLVLDPWSGRL